MAVEQRLVAVISPWDKLSELVKLGFRVQSVPKEKKVLVWRDDLQEEGPLVDQLTRIGISEIETRTRPVTSWRDVD